MVSGQLNLVSSINSETLQTLWILRRRQKRRATIPNVSGLPLTSKQFDESNQALIGSLESTDWENQVSQKSLIMKSMQARFAVEALEIDEAIGTWLLQVWKRQFSVGSEERATDFKSLEQYLKLRLVDAGAE
jgi:hypothetical protein